MRYSNMIAKVCILLVLVCWVPALVSAEVGFGIKGGMLLPDQDPFKDEYDEDILIGGVLEFDSNMGLTLEANLEYFSQKGNSGGDITIFPFIVSAKYNFFPRYRTTPFIGFGIGTYFFDQEPGSSATRFGTRVSGGLRFFEDRRLNIVVEAARNFVDFDNMNASSFQFTMSVLFDFYSSVIGGF